MKSNPLISVIIPVFNAGAYIDRCLDSVVRQKYRPLEVVLVDDGSTDNSAEICQRFLESTSADFSVTVYRQSNSGASLARKQGIQLAKGEYLTFIDSDDFVSDEYVIQLYRAIEKFDTNISVCTFQRVNPGEQISHAKQFSSHLMDEKELFQRFFKYEFWGFPGALYNKIVFDTVIFPEATVNEDYYVKAQIFTANPRVAVVTPALYFYEQHVGSLSKQPLSLRALGEFDNALATWQYMRDNHAKYSKHSLAIASEAACKWLISLLQDKSNLLSLEDRKHYKNKIRAFLTNNLFSILANPHLLWKIKLMLIFSLIKSYV